ncbi:hypothetical protein FOL47_004336 [Perkinsus chesapeaki]|uniref:Uncharacterized protein n=1 Tax=Perkinsus chesapeaki TaxID=330153 RepID=A0A7J6M3F0_PERCH|nr:hypothetical protein FOL47_004336 [Perkinsus chesapeaki]
MKLTAFHPLLAIVVGWGNDKNKPTGGQHRPTQVEIPFNEFGELSHSQLQHIQSTVFHDKKANPGEIGGLIVTPDGRELLAVTANAQFLSLRLADRRDNLFEIEKLWRHEMLNIEGEVMTQDECSPWGLTTGAVYGGSVKGDFYVTCANNPGIGLQVPDPCITLRFKDNAVSDVALASVWESCETNPAMTAVLKLREYEDAVLLVVYYEWIEANPSFSGVAVPTGSTVDGVKVLTIVMHGDYQLVSMSQFNNGDVMMLLNKPNAPEGNREMIIAYSTAADVSAAVHLLSPLSPKVLLRLRETDGVPAPGARFIQFILHRFTLRCYHTLSNDFRPWYNIGDVKGLAIQEDPKTGRSFIYIIGNIYNHAENRLEMQLAKYAWTPKVKSE